MIAIRREALDKLMSDKKFVKKLEKCKTMKDVEKLIIKFAKKHKLKIGFYNPLLEPPKEVKQAIEAISKLSCWLPNPTLYNFYKKLRVGENDNTQD